MHYHSECPAIQTILYYMKNTPVKDHVCQAGIALHVSMLAVPDPPDVLHMPQNCTQDDLLHDLSQTQDENGRPVVSWIFLHTLLVDQCHISKSPTIWNICG